MSRVCLPGACVQVPTAGAPKVGGKSKRAEWLTIRLRGRVRIGALSPYGLVMGLAA